MKPITIAIIAIASLLLLIIVLLIAVNHFLSKVFKERKDPHPQFKFLSLKDFPGLIMKDTYVDSVYKAKLHGGVFYYKKEKHHGVIVFFHGFLSGYINYLNLINYFAKTGFIVVAFDAYGCYTSEGKGMKGFPVYDKDNKQIINFVKNHPELNKYPLFTLGHSWGGHASLTSLLHEDLAIKKACGIAPFNSNVDVTYSANKYLKILAPFIYIVNLIKFGHESTYSVTNALKYTTADVLIVSGDKDNIVKPRYSHDKYEKVIKDNNLSNVTLKYYPNRKHSPFLSQRGEEHFFTEIQTLQGKPINFERLNYSLLNELDENVLQEIVNFFLE